ncbi:protein containing Peptidase M23 domain protein, partial [human gut metagenome]
TVTQGQQLGTVGSTGASTGNHLHLELFVDGALTDTRTMIPYDNTTSPDLHLTTTLDFICPLESYTAISAPFRTDDSDTPPHLGVDFAAAGGTPVQAAQSGVVTQADWDDNQAKKENAMKQKHIIALCAITTIAVLGAVAGTGAYLTHQTPQTVNTFAVGQLEAELTEPEWDKLPDEAKVLYPGKTVAKDPTACNAAESTTAAYMYLQVEIPRASVRTYTIAETAKADGSDETNQEPTSGAGVLDNGGEPHTVDLVSFQPNDGWSLLEETETEETHTFIYA